MAAANPDLLRVCSACLRHPRTCGCGALVHTRITIALVRCFACVDALVGVYIFHNPPVTAAVARRDFFNRRRRGHCDCCGCDSRVIPACSFLTLCKGRGRGEGKGGEHAIVAGDCMRRPDLDTVQRACVGRVLVESAEPRDG